MTANSEYITDLHKKAVNTYKQQKISRRREVNATYYITYDNETIVYDSSNKQLVKCPTEQEAIEYIHDNNH